MKTVRLHPLYVLWQSVYPVYGQFEYLNLINTTVNSLTDNQHSHIAIFWTNTKSYSSVEIFIPNHFLPVFSKTLYNEPKRQHKHVLGGKINFLPIKRPLIKENNNGAKISKVDSELPSPSANPSTSRKLTIESAEVLPETIIPPESPPSSATTSCLNPDHSHASAHNDRFVKLYEYDIGNYVDNIRSLSDAEKHDLINNVFRPDANFKLN